MRYLTVFILMISNVTFSQETVSYSSIDSLSYSEYLKNDFNALKETGRKALKEGVDFYDLRMRLGILAYNEKNYEYAVKHFEAAYAMNPANEIVQEYLYYTYLFTGRTENSNALASSLTPEFQKKVGYTKKKIDSIILTGGTFINSNVNDGKLKRIISPPYNFGYANYNGTTNGGGLIFENTFGNRLHFYNKVAGFKTNTYTFYEYALKDNYKPNVVKKIKSEREYSNLQLQYNIGMAYQTRKGYLIGVGGAFFQTNTTGLLSSVVIDSSRAVLTDTIMKYSNYLGSISLGKRMKYIFPQITGTYSNLYGNNQYQGEVSISYFPLGNMKLFGNTSFAYIDNNKVAQNVFSQKIGYVISKNLWLEARYSKGNHNNYMSSLGFTSYNTPDPVMLNSGLDIHFSIKKLEVILGYGFQKREGAYYQSSYLGENKVQYNYTNTNLTTTLKWNF
jgi:hypothetical protein